MSGCGSRGRFDYEGRASESLDIKELFRILTAVMVTQIYTCVKIQKVIYPKKRPFYSKITFKIRFKRASVRFLETVWNILLL